MEPSRFDNLTKALATSTSRRQALKAVGATLGGALGLSRIGIAFADQCKPLGAKCFKRQQCCSGICSNGMCVAPTTTTTTTTTPPPARVFYSCVCADSTRLPPICNLIPCTDDGFAVCAQ